MLNALEEELNDNLQNSRAAAAHPEYVQLQKRFVELGNFAAIDESDAEEKDER